MRVVIATVQVPFVRGGAEAHAEGLRAALVRAGYEAEIVGIPFKWYPPERMLDQILACRLLDLTESEGRAIDRLIALKFPAYYVRHPRKVLWILHQHRPAYDLWNSPLGDMAQYPNGHLVQDAIRQADMQLIPEARAIFANSRNVAERLKKYCGIEARPLYHPPPNADMFYVAEAEDYFFFPSRVTPNKRQRLILEALACTGEEVRVRFASSSDHPTYYPEMKKLAWTLGVEKRVEWLGAVSEEEKARLYAHALGILYTPEDEDYGYVTLEAMLASKPVITCKDSGGSLEFVIDGENGLIADGAPESLALAMDTLWRDRKLASAMGKAGHKRYRDLGIDWSQVIEALLA
jgi:glycosyltransferase involved in cell wall biosynthesis